jgi:hypothetical protein
VQLKRSTSLALAALISAVLGTGCKERKYAVGPLEIADDTIRANPLLAMTPAQVSELLAYQLSQSRFELVPEGQRTSRSAIPLQLEIAYTREGQKEGRDGTYAEVGARLTLRRRETDGSASYEVVSLSESRIPSDEQASRRRAMRSALVAAVQQVVASARLQLDALEKSDSALVKDLNAKDPRVREFAVRVLSARKNPAVERALLEKLQGSDPDSVRRAIGALVELKNAASVPHLIDVAKGKDPSFVREVIFALGEIGGDEAEAYLYTVAEGHDQPAIRAAAQKALDELRSRQRAGSTGRADSRRDRLLPGTSP